MFPNTLLTNEVPITVITPCSLTSRSAKKPQSEKLIVECVPPCLALPCIESLYNTLMSAHSNGYWSSSILNYHLTQSGHNGSMDHSAWSFTSPPFSPPASISPPFPISPSFHSLPSSLLHSHKLTYAAR